MKISFSMFRYNCTLFTREMFNGINWVLICKIRLNSNTRASRTFKIILAVQNWLKKFADLFSQILDGRHALHFFN